MSNAPVLSPEQVDRIRAHSTLRRVSQGEILYQPDDETPPVFVVMSGAIEIVAVAGDTTQLVITYTVGQFSGELLMIAGRRSIYRCQVKESGELLQLEARDLRVLIGTDSELSELFMKVFLTRRLSLRHAGYGNVMILGSGHSANTLVLREFLTRDGHPFAYLDLDTDPTVQEILGKFGVSISDIPVVICNGATVLRNPTIREVAERLGFNINIDESSVRDVVVVGAGPAGLTAAVYAASEGLDVLVIEGAAPGGQAGSSSKIENYLGFPAGVSGQELAARALAQSEKFGAQIMVARSVAGIGCDERPYKLILDNGLAIRCRTIILATGAQYSVPKVDAFAHFVGRGVHYSATHMEAQLCRGEQVVIIGGGNSAGQAAVFLAQSCKGVKLLVRSAGLAASMSRYLIRRIESNPRIELHFLSEVTGLRGSDALEQVSWTDRRSNEERDEAIRHVFVMTGASPRTEWLSGCLALDDKGFVLTGHDVVSSERKRPWPLARPPRMLEASVPGVFVVGDARSGNVKRVASAVGEGSVVVHMVHQALAES
ncbi:MAG: FAD-dependent oxidoreductase [Croceibacterium sp.]